MNRLPVLLAGALFCLPALSATTMFAEESIQVTVVGTLKTGIVAIGAETTGATITANKVTWELDFGKNDELRAAAEKLNGQPVTVTGSLEKRSGVEVKERWIVTVSSLHAADKKKVIVDDTRLEARDVREGTKVVFEGNQDEAIVEIRCERGIDRCTVVRKGKQWPKQLTLRLHLRGLESCKARADDTTVAWAVESTGDHASHSTLTSEKRETQLEAGEPYHTVARPVPSPDPVRIVKQSSQQAEVLIPGCFEVPLPAKLLEGNPEQLHLQWIDFYR